MSDERAALAARHRPRSGYSKNWTVCEDCGQLWGDKGCDTARALALLDEVISILDAVGDCHGCLNHDPDAKARLEEIR